MECCVANKCRGILIAKTGRGYETCVGKATGDDCSPVCNEGYEQVGSLEFTMLCDGAGRFRDLSTGDCAPTCKVHSCSVGTVLRSDSAKIACSGSCTDVVCCETPETHCTQISNIYQCAAERRCLANTTCAASPCLTHSNGISCNSDSMCSWVGQECVTGCGQYSSSGTSCTYASGCEWFPAANETDDGTCSDSGDAGTPQYIQTTSPSKISCSSYTTDVQCATYGCAWDEAWDVCSSRMADCSQYSSASQCWGQSSCVYYSVAESCTPDPYCYLTQDEAFCGSPCSFNRGNKQCEFPGQYGPTMGLVLGNSTGLEYLRDFESEHSLPPGALHLVAYATHPANGSTTVYFQPVAPSSFSKIQDAVVSLGGWVSSAQMESTTPAPANSTSSNGGSDDISGYVVGFWLFLAVLFILFIAAIMYFFCVTGEDDDNGEADSAKAPTHDGSQPNSYPPTYPEDLYYDVRQETPTTSAAPSMPYYTPDPRNDPVFAEEGRREGEEEPQNPLSAAFPPTPTRQR
eukprot:TRINITY_DN11407_c2_g1_i2.p1 TRINITY_DN11407_c2_g1~~TRINITY_DN11407_c2_g1_i2.p1  ORF type:complete len:559 (+),score=-7.84 TRINITY_DN11407_c2_g1_i2:128-1678(+)